MNAWFPRITVHSLAIVLSVLTYVLTTRVEHERRPPSIAIAWVLGMIAVPYVVLPMYLMFGRRKLPRRVLRWSGIAIALRTLGRGSDREFRPAAMRPRRGPTAPRRQ